MLIACDQIEYINPLFLLTAKPVVYLCNVSESDYIKKRSKQYLKPVQEWIAKNSPGDPLIPISVCLEERLTGFETEEEVKKELEKIGASSALPKCITTMRKALDLGSFFTTGTDEVRQWTIRNGTKAPQAAGVIHGDFEKTFIQVIVYNFSALKEYGDESELKAKGKVMTKGKDYVVEDVSQRSLLLALHSATDSILSTHHANTNRVISYSSKLVPQRDRELISYNET